uniref:Uncharacterized protein n=1 Tax=Anopheles farauti TaxID=69004 RepID=A0A182QWA2_9DIPT
MCEMRLANIRQKTPCLLRLHELVAGAGRWLTEELSGTGGILPEAHGPRTRTGSTWGGGVVADKGERAESGNILPYRGLSLRSARCVPKLSVRRTTQSPTVASVRSNRLLVLLLAPYRSPAAELFHDRLNRPLDSRGFGSPVGPASSSGQGSSSRPNFITFTVWGASFASASFSLAESSMYSPFSSSRP